MSDAELYALSSEVDEWDEDKDLFEGCDMGGEEE